MVMPCIRVYLYLWVTSLVNSASIARLFFHRSPSAEQTSSSATMARDCVSHSFLVAAVTRMPRGIAGLRCQVDGVRRILSCPVKLSCRSDGGLKSAGREQLVLRDDSLRKLSVFCVQGWHKFDICA